MVAGLRLNDFGNHTGGTNRFLLYINMCDTRQHTIIFAQENEQK